MALPLVGPLRVAQPMTLDGQEEIVAVYVHEPDDAWFDAFAVVHEMPEGPERESAAEALYEPTRIAPFFSGWEGPGHWDAEAGAVVPTPYTAEAFVSACRHRAFHGLAMSAIARAVAGRVRGNFAPSPAGSTGEGQGAAGAAAPSPSAEQ